MGFSYGILFDFEVNEIYFRLRLVTNYFTPTMKSISKERIGSKVIKKHDEPKTPCQRLLECSYISDGDKEKLKRKYSELNPAKLMREILQIQKKLSVAVRKKREKRHNGYVGQCSKKFV